MEQQTAVFPICQYIKGNGIRCGSPALSGARYCYHHFGGSVSALKSAHAQSASQVGKLKFVDPISREAIQHNLFVIAQGINGGKLDLIVANFYHRIFRSCEINFTRWERSNKDNPEKQMALPNAVIPSEAEEPAKFVIPSEATEGRATEGPAPHDDSTTTTPNVVIPNEACAANEAEAPALLSPLPFPHSPSNRPIFANRDALYNSEQAKQLFREIDKRYMNSPDYGQRTREALDALLRGGPVYEWLHEILERAGLTPIPESLCFEASAFQSTRSSGSGGLTQGSSRPQQLRNWSKGSVRSRGATGCSALFPLPRDPRSEC